MPLPPRLCARAQLPLVAAAAATVADMLPSPTLEVYMWQSEGATRPPSHPPAQCTRTGMAWCAWRMLRPPCMLRWTWCVTRCAPWAAPAYCWRGRAGVCALSSCAAGAQAPAWLRPGCGYASWAMGFVHSVQRLNDGINMRSEPSRQQAARTQGTQGCPAVLSPRVWDPVPALRSMDGGRCGRTSPGPVPCPPLLGAAQDN